jgi:hypothetical protein
MERYFTRKSSFRGKYGIQFGRLLNCSAFVPKYLQKTNKTNCIEDWESKIDAIVEETFNENMTVILNSVLGSNVF